MTMRFPGEAHARLANDGDGFGGQCCCSHKFLKGGGEFIFLCPLPSMAGTRVRPRPSKEGWCLEFDQLIFMFVLYGDGMKFEHLADSTLNSISGRPTFPQHLRQYANSRIQNFRKQLQLGSTGLPDISTLSPSLFEPNEFIDYLFARKMNDLRNQVLKNKSPVRNSNTLLGQYHPHHDPAGATPLINSSHMDANPLGLWVTTGGSLRMTDLGDRFSNWMRIVYQLRCPADAKKMKLVIVIDEKDEHGLGQSLLKVSFPANSQSQYNDHLDIEGSAEVSIAIANAGNVKYQTNLPSRVAASESQLAETPPDTIKSILLRNPVDPTTGLPYTCHNLFWQGVTHDHHVTDPCHLRSYEIPIDGKDDEVPDFAAGDEAAVTRQYLTWYIPISGGDKMKLQGPVRAPVVLSGRDMRMHARRMTNGM